MASGAEVLVATVRRAGVELCLANPGTTELPLVAALDRAPGLRPVLGLHENVCTGAADGYARIAGRPALTLLHLGPGLGNGLANLHNARRAGSPVLNVVGEHASWHLGADPPLAMDIEAVAAPVSALVRRIASADDTGPATAEALAATARGRGAVATLIFPHDHQEAPARPFAGAIAWPALPPPGEAAPALAAAALRMPGAKALYLGGRALFGRGLAAAGRIARATGAALFAEVGFARLEAGAGLPPLARLPYFPEAAQAALDGFSQVIVCGAKPPVSFFGYRDRPSRYLEGRDGVVRLAGADDDSAGALDALADRLGAREAWHGTAEPLMPGEGGLDAESLGQTLAALLPEDAILVLTAVSSAFPFSRLAARARPHTQLALTGGAIGEGPALAVGAALAAPGRRIVNLEADGSGAYLPQAFWTQAREGLDIVTVICSNRRYRILEIELERAGLAPGPAARALTRLDRPPLDWPSIARGFGVPGERVGDATALADALRRAFATPGPTLIEALL